jgi:hypothetical protein
MRALITPAAALIVAVVAAWLLRWDVTAAASEEEVTGYLLDRWTGEVYVIAHGEAVLHRRVEQSTRPPPAAQGKEKEKEKQKE